MRVWAEEILRWALASVIGWCLLWCLVFVKDIQGHNGMVVKGEGWVGTDELRIAHKFHGINVSFRDVNGWHFYRDGRRCQLFTKECLERIERRGVRG